MRSSRITQAEHIRKLLGSDLADAHQLFPDADDELASLFEVDLRAESAVDKALVALGNDESIEYAHVPAERRPSV